MIVRKKWLVKSVALLLSVVPMSITANAMPTQQNEVNVIQPFWINTSRVAATLEINNGAASVYCSVIGYTGTTKITGKAVLERLESNGRYSEVKTWDDLSASGNTLTFEKTYYVTKGYTYLLTFTPTVYKDGVGETVSDSQSAYAG